MPSFSEESLYQLNSCDMQLQRLFYEVVKDFDCKVICGYRDEVEQNAFFKDGKTKVKYPDSKHNWVPSRAVDVVPYPVDWNNLNRFYVFGGYVKGIANKLGIKIRWGGDWDNDNDITDQNFNDLPHFELIF